MYDGYECFEYKHEKRKKFLAIVFAIIILIGGFIYLKGRYKDMYSYTLGVKIEIPSNLKVVKTEKILFDYKDTKISSNTISMINKKKSTLSLKAFPFSAEEYKKNYKSAFNNPYIETIKYDYKKINSKNKSIENIYESRAILRLDKSKKDYYIYLIELKNKEGCLIVESFGTHNIKKVVNSIEILKNKKSSIEKPSVVVVPTNSEVKVDNIKEGLNYYVPTQYTKKKFKINDSEIVNYYGFNRNILSFKISKNANDISWSSWENNLGFEIIDKISENEYIVHNLNNHREAFLNTKTDEFIYRGQKYYVRIDYYDLFSDLYYFNNIMKK